MLTRDLVPIHDDGVSAEARNASKGSLITKDNIGLQGQRMAKGEDVVTLARGDGRRPHVNRVDEERVIAIGIRDLQVADGKEARSGMEHGVDDADIVAGILLPKPGRRTGGNNIEAERDIRLRGPEPSPG